MKGVETARWSKLSPLLDELLDLDDAERAARLAQIAHDDQALADQLGALLARQDRIEREGFLEGNALGKLDPTLAGQTLGAYTLEHPLGAGGMGSVWLARRSDGRYEGKVAVKLLNLALVARGGAERFAREGSLLARLTHPNIARLLDAGVAPGGQPYLVLEHVAGEPIDRWCDARALGIEARVRLMLDVLAAVAHAHSKLVLHRDLKPANILVTPEGQVKLLDFGIAKLLEDEAAPVQATELTQLAGRAFTPDFAAPEQVEGGDVTTATDVYALGVLLYVLLGGVHPTIKPTHTPVQRLRSIVETEPARLSEAAARAAAGESHTRALRGDLDNIVDKALRKDPAQRYPTAAALADDLHRYLANEPVVARPDSLGYRAAKFVRRHRFAVGAVSTTVVVLIAGVVGTTWQAIEARRERDEAIRQTERASARTGFFDLVLSATGDPDRPITQREILDRSVVMIEKHFAHDPRIAIDLLYPIAGQYYTIGDAEKDVAVMRRAAELAAATGDPQLIGHVACNTVPSELSRGRIDLAREQMQIARAAFRRLAEPTFQALMECQRSEAEIAQAEGDLDRAAQLVADAVARCEGTGNIGGTLYTALLIYLAALHEQRGALKESFDITQQVRELQERRGLATSLKYQVNRQRQARLLMAWGEYREAQAVIDGITPRLRDLSGDAGPPPWLDTVRGQLAARFGDLQAAEALLRVARERARARASAILAAPAEFALARVLIEQRRFEEAEILLDEVEKALPPVAGRITPATVRASLRLSQGAIDNAREVIDAELRRLGDTNSAARAIALRVSVHVHTAAGDTALALQSAKDAVAAAERIARDPERSADVGEARLLLARAQQAAGAAHEASATARLAAAALSHGLGDNHALTRQALVLARG
jgi:serine/threonine-protein kinase